MLGCVFRVPGHISNYAYEKLVERFLYIYNERRLAVNTNHEATKSARENIDQENEIAEALQRDLDREKQVRSEVLCALIQILIISKRLQLQLHFYLPSCHGREITKRFFKSSTQTATYAHLSITHCGGFALPYYY